MGHCCYLQPDPGYATLLHSRKLSKSLFEEPDPPFSDLPCDKHYFKQPLLKATLVPLHYFGFQTQRRCSRKRGARGKGQTLQSIIRGPMQSHVRGDWEPRLMAVKGTAESIPPANLAVVLEGIDSTSQPFTVLNSWKCPGPASCTSLGKPISSLGLSFLKMEGSGNVKALVRTAGSGESKPS